MKTELERAAEWLLGNDTGSSSKAICAHMLGLDGGTSYPHDGADRGRCVRLLQLIPEWIPRLDEMATIKPAGTTLVIGASGMRRDDNSWASQVPLIKEALK